MRSIGSMRSSRAALSLALFLAPLAAYAQDPRSDSLPPIRARSETTTALTRFQRRFSGQLAAVQMRPVGELARNVGFGYGVEGAVSMQLDDAGIMALRAELGLVQYGSEHTRVPLSPTTGRIDVDVTTVYDVWMGGLGVQAMAPSGAVRPYLSGAAGVVSFVTESSVQGSSDTEPFAQTTNHQDTGFTWLAGGGVYIPIHRGAQLISVDLGATYHATQGRRSYLRPGSIHDLPGGGIAIDPLYSEAKFVTWRVGVRIGG